MAITELYVDPSTPGDTGAGSKADPYHDLEYAIEQETFDVTNGTRINVKAGTDEILAAALNVAFADTSVSIAWVPTVNAPLTIQGYTTDAGDGGKGGISGGGAVSVIDGSDLDYVNLIDLHLHNCNNLDIVDLDNDCSAINCEINNTSANGIKVDSNSLIVGCYIHDIGNLGIECNSGSIINNYLENGTKTFVTAIKPAGITNIARNIISIGGASDGIAPWIGCNCDHNSVYSNGGTGQGIFINNSQQITSIRNNLVEGFSGSGGVGIDVQGTTARIAYYGGNAVFNCENEYVAAATTTIYYAAGDNETLTASPFTDASGGDFSPVDTGNVKEGSIPADFGDGAI